MLFREREHGCECDMCFVGKVGAENFCTESEAKERRRQGKAKGRRERLTFLGFSRVDSQLLLFPSLMLCTTDALYTPAFGIGIGIRVVEVESEREREREESFGRSTTVSLPSRRNTKKYIRIYSMYI